MRRRGRETTTVPGGSFKPGGVDGIGPDHRRTRPRPAPGGGAQSRDFLCRWARSAQRPLWRWAALGRFAGPYGGGGGCPLDSDHPRPRCALGGDVGPVRPHLAVATPSSSHPGEGGTLQRRGVGGSAPFDLRRPLRIGTTLSRPSRTRWGPISPSPPPSRRRQWGGRGGNRCVGLVERRRGGGGGSRRHRRGRVRRRRGGPCSPTL